MKDELIYLEIKPTGSILFTSEEKDVLFQYIAKLQVENDKLQDLIIDLMQEYESSYLKLPSRLINRIKELEIEME